MKSFKTWLLTLLLSLLLLALAVVIVAVYDQPNMSYDITLLGTVIGQLLMTVFAIMTLTSMMYVFAYRNADFSQLRPRMLQAALAGMLCLGFGGFSTWGAQIGLGIFAAALVAHSIWAKPAGANQKDGM